MTCTVTGAPCIKFGAPGIELLKAQGRDYDAQFVEKQFRTYWDGGAFKLKVEDLV